MERIGRSVAEAEYLFQPTKNTYDGEVKKKLSHTAVGYIVKKWAKKINPSKRITPHSARATFISSLIDNGEDIYYVSQLVNHADVRTTQRYNKRQRGVNNILVSKRENPPLVFWGEISLKSIKSNHNLLVNLEHKELAVGTKGTKRDRVYNLSDWRTSTRLEISSVQIDPKFQTVDRNGFKPAKLLYKDLIGSSIDTPEVDFFGASRPLSKSTIGAVEIQSGK